MPQSYSSCIKVSDTQICPYCYSSKIVKNGHTKTGKQQYLCNSCSKIFLDYHTYNACKPETNLLIISLTKEGMGVRSIARILAISATTLLKRYIKIAGNIKRPILTMSQQYEVDELNFYNGNKNKRIWLVCALDQRTRQIVSFNIGKRTNKTLNYVIKTLTNSKAQKIYTDRLHNYRTMYEYITLSTLISYFFFKELSNYRFTHFFLFF